MGKKMVLLPVLLLLVPSHPVADTVTERVHQRVDRFSETEHALLASYYAALEQSAVREAINSILLRQLRIIPPVAFVDGYWVTPVDFAQLFEIPAVREGVGAALARSSQRREVTQLLNTPNRLRQLAAFAFSANPLRAELSIPYVGDVARIGKREPERGGVLVAPVKDVEWAVSERVPPHPRTAPEAELGCYFFCGDPTDWDFDRDGIVNARDDDDDGDGVPDERDAYPYWPGASTCPCGDAEFVGFTETFSVGITNAVLAAYQLVTDTGATNRAVVLGAVPGGSNRVQFVFPAAAPANLVSPAHACPDSTDSSVRYVSTDAKACAVLRFRCRVGEVPFSDECGCGCKGG